MNNITRITNFREFSIWLIIILASFGILLILPEPNPAHTVLHYVPLHTSMEIVAIAISAMIFGISWVTQRYQPNGRSLALGIGFLGVAILDVSHTLSFVGMPDFVTVNNAEKTINFWLMARLCAVLSFLLVAFWPYRLADWIGYHSRYWALTLIVLLIGLIHFVLLYWQTLLPHTYVEGVGLTDFKINVEYLLIILYVLAGIGLLLHAKHQSQTSNALLALSSFTMAASEYFFTLYANVGDAYNVAGHVYKIIAYGFLYRGLFLVTVRHPYEALKESEAQYAATLNTLPDLLFEVDRQGVYHSVHASKLEKLAAPLESIVGRRLEQMLPPDAAQICYEAINEADQNGSSNGHRIELAVPAGLRYFELSIAKKINQKDNGVTFLVLSRDITETVVNERKFLFESKVNATLLMIQEQAESEQQAEFLQRTVAYIQVLMEGPVAFIYAVHDDQSTCNLLIWSESSAEKNAAVSTTSSVSLVETGTWADSLRTSRPVVIDDVISGRDTKGLPVRQNELQRLVCVPVMEDGQVKLLVGVGDKSKEYTSEEVHALQLVATTLWSMLKQRSNNAVINRLSAALEQSPHSVVITDTKARIQYVNKAFCNVSGYSLMELIGQNPRILQSGETPKSMYRELWSRLNSNESWQGEFINRKKDGEIYVESVAVYPIQDQFGEITHYVAHKVDITEHKAAEKRIRDLSDFDSLTGLLNKKSFYQYLTKAISEAAEQNETIFLLWFNLDNFKIINDTLGHDVGDELLVVVANKLLNAIGIRFTLARHSGDTFVAIIPREVQSLVTVLAAEVLNKIKSPMHVASQNVSISASVGIAVYPDDAKTAGTLASAAEIAMYRAKEEGRNSLRFFAVEMQHNTQRSLDLAASLNEAHDRGELYLVYQPQLLLSSSMTVGVEVLLRWKHPKWGPVGPGEFIPLAEQTGLIVPIGFWMIEQVANQLREWEKIGLSNILVAINVSAIQFIRPGFVDELIKVMSKASVPTNRIEIEITEAVALKNSEQAVTIIQQLHAAGFKIALDDFGTGYSSLSYLRRYAIDKLKIDQSFINELVSSEGDQSIVLAIINMAHGLHMKTIAEGVETAEQARLLKELGCDELQGYWFSRPISAAEFEDLYRDQPFKPSIQL